MIKIVTDSTADIPPEMAQGLGIAIIPTHIVFGRETYRDGIDLTREQFYNKLAGSRVLPSTAAPGIGEYEAVYREVVQDSDCDAIVSIQLAANLSAVYSAAVAGAELAAAATGTPIHVVDSGQATMGYGWMAVAAAEATRHGATLDEILAVIDAMKPRTHVLAVLDTLEYIYRGGRVGWAQALIGTMLRIKPMIDVTLGEVKLIERTRTMDRAIGHLIEHVQTMGPLERAIVVHAGAPRLGERVVSQLRAAYPDWTPMIAHAGVTIASHAGPGAVGIACVSSHQSSADR